MLRLLLLLPALAVGFAAGVVCFHPNPGRYLAISEPAAGHLILGELELRKDSPLALQRALDHYRDALAAGAEIEAHAGAAEVELARAEALAAAATWSAPSPGHVDPGPQALDVAARGFAHARAALILDPGDAAANRAMADYFRLKGDLPRMREALVTARRRAPGDPGSAFVECAGLSIDGNRRPEAVACLEALVARAPEQQRARLALATLWAADGRIDEARAAVATLLTEVSDHEGAQRLRTALDRVAAERSAASAAASAASAAASPAAPPPSAPGAAGAGVAGDGAATPPPGAAPGATPMPTETAYVDDDADGDDAKPGPDAKASVAEKALLNRAGKLRRAGSARQAIELYEQALLQRPALVNAMAGKAWCLYDLGRNEEAASLFRAAASLKPRAPGAQLGLGDALRALGHRDEAATHYGRFLQLAPNAPEAERVRRVLRELGPQ